MVRRRREEVHVNQERWLVSYADFITLLFAFFVVMYSISQVSDSKYRVLSDTFVEAFNQSKNTPTTSEPDDQSTSANNTINPIELDNTPIKPDTVTNEQPVISDGGDPQQISPELDAVEDTEQPKTSDELTQISELVTEKFSQLINDQMIQVSSNELWLQIELRDSILFSSGSADASEQAQRIFDEIALILKNYSNPVQVEGFTDNIPIK